MKSSLHILNLEDSVNDAELNQEMVSARWPACKLLRVDNRADFISALDRGGFDLILSDFTMPGFNGLEALELARSKLPEVPFLFVSGTIGEDTAIEALKNGATDYVLKHRLVRLIPAVDRALREAGERAECRRAEEAMRQSEHKYRELFDCLGDAAFLADEPTGRIIDTNRRAGELLGCARQDILGCKETRFLTLNQSHAPANASGTDRQTSSATEGELIRQDGGRLRVEVHTTRLMLYGCPLVLRLAHDPVERSPNELNSEMGCRLAAIVQSSDDAIIGKTLDGTITSWNAGAQKIYGYTEQEAIGQPLRMLIPPDRQAEESDLLARIARGENIDHFETVRVRKNGTLIEVSVTISPIRDVRGKIIGASKIARDITERKLAEEKIQRLNAELEQRVAERTVKLQAANQELESFSYSVSHDLRAPLRHVAGFVELLQKEAGPTLPEKARRHLATISDAAGQMGDLIDDLLALSRVGRAALHKVDVKLDQLVRETADEFQAETKDRKLSWQIHPLPVVHADRDLLRLALRNLIANAVKFTSARAGAMIEIGALPEGENAAPTVIFIRDNGAGFDPRYAGKLFGVFQRLHSRKEFPGTGIGLANVQRIIQKHGGRVWAEGAVDRGAIFSFSLPAASGSTNEP